MAAAGCAAALGQAVLSRPLAAPGPAANLRTSSGASTSYAQPAAAPRQGAQQRRRQWAAGRRGRSSALHVAAAAPAFGQGEIVEVKDLKGIRVLKNEDDTPRVEYLVEWKDGSPDTWEVAANLADNLLRDYEQRWWGAVKKGDDETMYKMMEGGGDVLARTVDENRRSALHFAAAMGKAELVARLLKAGGEVDLADKEGYTPLHMAAGYMHTSTIAALLAGGADPEQGDRQGRSPLELVEGLRKALPPNNPLLVQRRMALENVVQMLTANMFEDVEPAAVLERRVVYPEAEKKEGEETEGQQKEGEKKEEGEEKKAEGEEQKEEGEEAAVAAGPARTEWLIKFPDEDEPVWVEERYVSREVVEDYEAGLEYAQAEAVLDCRQRGTMRNYLVRWQDGYPDTWEPEEHVSPDLIALYERQKGLFDASSDADGSDTGGSDSSSSGGGSNGGHASGAGVVAAAAAAPATQLQGTAA
ncbi:hypothetical protein ABPG75_008479 [Micractinium tetrahymenae]